MSPARSAATAAGRSAPDHPPPSAKSPRADSSGAAPPNSAPRDKNQSDTDRPPGRRSEYVSQTHPRWPSHNLATLYRFQNRLGERIERHVFRKKLFQHRPQQINSHPFKRRLIQRQEYFQSARKGD